MEIEQNTIELIRSLIFLVEKSTQIFNNGEPDEDGFIYMRLEAQKALECKKLVNQLSKIFDVR